MAKNWRTVIKEVFPHAEILDAALNYPISDTGWDISVPESPAQCTFQDPDYHLFVNLQDMLTGKELINLNKHFVRGGFPLHRVTVLVWAKHIQASLPEHSVNVINFSSHQYETWCSYSEHEQELRDAFHRDRKQFEYNFVCPQRIYKPHRAALHRVLGSYVHANISLQSKGLELAYPSLTFKEYDASYDNCVNLLAMRKNYNTALFAIVSESQYTQRYGIITEKTFNAIVAGVPFLLVAHRHALCDVNDYGFMSYPNLFNESYDARDNQSRIKTMIEDNDSYIKGGLRADEMQSIYLDAQSIAEYNRNYFFDQFGDQLISELRIDLLGIWGQ